MNVFIRDGLEFLFIVAVGGMVVSAVRRLRNGAIKVNLCESCKRPISRAYPKCPKCGYEPAHIDSSLPQGDEKVVMVRAMFDKIAPRYDLINRIISLGLDTKWRKKSIRLLNLPEDSKVLDLASGTGEYCELLLDAGHRPIGVDLSFGMLEHARVNADFVQADVLKLPFKAVDGVTCGFGLRNFVELEPFFEELARVVRPGGRIALLDASTPESPILKAGHAIYFGKIVPIIGGLMADRSAYRYLPKSLSYMPSTQDLISMIEKAGFSNIERTTFTGGSAYLITATRTTE